MISLKNPSEIEIMRQGGKILTTVLGLLFNNIHVGTKLADLDKMAEAEIVKRGGLSSFKKVKGYQWTICTCINDVVVHGVPNDYRVKAGDVVGIDCGVFYKGFHTDSAWTKGILNEDEIDRFLKVGEETLKEALKQVKPGNYIYDISKSIQDKIEGARYSVVKSLVGHGVGRKLHEEPEIPGVVTNERFKTPLLKEGMTLAVEVIYNMGKPDVNIDGSDGWTIRTKDGRISGLFEATVAVVPHGSLVLSCYGAPGDY